MSKDVVIERVTCDGRKQVDDLVAVEDPFEIRVVFGPQDNRRSQEPFDHHANAGKAIRNLPLDFCFPKTSLTIQNQIVSFEHVGPVAPGTSHGNTLMVELGDGVGTSD